MSRSFVVDASVALKLLVEEPGSAQARLFFGQLDSPEPPAFYVPDLLYVECANTIWKYVWRHHYAARAAQAALAALAALNLQAVPTQHLFQDAFRLSVRHRISAYDACYLALAQRLRCPLVTEDLDLVGKIHAHASTVLFALADVLK